MKQTCAGSAPPLRLFRRTTSSIGAGLLALLVSSTGLAQSQSAGPARLFQEAVEAQQRGDDALAVRKYRALLALHPEAVAIRVNLGASLAQLKRYGEAINQYLSLIHI